MDPMIVMMSMCVVAGLPADAWRTLRVDAYLAALRGRFAS